MLIQIFKKPRHVWVFGIVCGFFLGDLLDSYLWGHVVEYRAESHDKYYTHFDKHLSRLEYDCYKEIWLDTALRP